jgi:hypothetical protein
MVAESIWLLIPIGKDMTSPGVDVPVNCELVIIIFKITTDTFI